MSQNISLINISLRLGMSQNISLIHLICPTAIYDSISWLRQSVIRSYRPIYIMRLGREQNIYPRYRKFEDTTNKKRRNIQFLGIFESCIICAYYSPRANIGCQRSRPNYNISGSETEHDNIGK